MSNQILGLHHITAISDNAQRNLDFYTGILGLRLVKKTVNFDDPGTYHFYYGDEKGTPGTILTFFPWEGIGKGYTGTGMATEIGYSVSPGSLAFWEDRFKQFNVPTKEKSERFGETHLPFSDPDGLALALVESKQTDSRNGWQTMAIHSEDTIKGFSQVTLTLRKAEMTAKILTDIFGYQLLSQEANRYRFITDAIST
ncbi:MAG TPA: ring-cleaving dioxygenase, partial [Puia sp.]|nr:ring-cleaving dioxygenase [Puia sp.]